MKNTILLIAMFVISFTTANGQISRTANTFKDTAFVFNYLDSIDNITIQCWAKRSTTTGTHTLISSVHIDGSTAADFKQNLLLQFVNNTLTARIADSSISITVTDTSWFHAALTKHNDSMHLYINGILLRSNKCPTHYYNIVGPGSPTNITTIAKSFLFPGITANLWSGNMYDLRIDTSISQIYYDTCNYNGIGAYVYAAMNNTDSVNIYKNGVASTYINGLSLSSACASIADTTTSSVGASNINAPIQEVTIAPNPTQTSITISSDVPIVNICIQNMLGQTVYSGSYNSNKAVVDFEQHPKGMYMVKINANRVYIVVKE